MNRVALVVVGLGLVAAPAAFADGKVGEELYAARCNTCHSAGVGGAPPTDKLKTAAPESIVEKLTTGTMQYMAAGLSDQDKRDIAEFLTGTAPAAAAPAEAPTPAAGETPAAAPAATPQP
jgi:mono/diheme cytochrome c family protein